MLSRSSMEFIGVSTFAALSGRAVATETFDPTRFPLGTHIEAPSEVALMLVAPATANLIGKFANGIADCLLSTSYLQCSAPILLAPAMSDPMWQKAAVQRNLETLKQDGCRIVGPNSGWLSCRQQGMGRMCEPDEIFASADEILKASDRR